jgi:molybdopterin synthase sulfur carrier subunit
MARVTITRNLQRHVPAPPAEAPGATVREVLESYFAAHPAVRGYVLDEHGALRRHMVIFVAGAMVRDRSALSDPVPPGGEVHVLQALSGG